MVFKPARARCQDSSFQRSHAAKVHTDSNLYLTSVLECLSSVEALHSIKTLCDPHLHDKTYQKFCYSIQYYVFTEIVQVPFSGERLELKYFADT